MSGTDHMELTLVVRRTIQASPQRLFDAWTSPEQLLVWWGPPDVDCVRAEVDLREGGQYRLDNQLPDGRILTISGSFTEIEPPRRLAYTWEIGEEPTQFVTVEFNGIAEGATEVVIVHTKIPDQGSKTEHRGGWRGCLDGLEAHTE